MNICRGGNGLPGHHPIAYDHYVCPWCADRNFQALIISELKEEIESLKKDLLKAEEYIKKLEG